MVVLQRYRSEVERFLRIFLPEWQEKSSSPLVAMLEYQFGLSDEKGQVVTGDLLGKMVRSALCLLSLEASSQGGDWLCGVPVAAGIEIFHTGTLIHDDVEDEDLERRHRPSVWARWGKSQAINAGDLAVLLSQKAILSTEASPALVEKIASYLLEQFMCVTFGQERDVSFEVLERITLAEYEAMIAQKTGALFCAAAV